MAGEREGNKRSETEIMLLLLRAQVTAAWRANKVIVVETLRWGPESRHWPLSVPLEQTKIPEQ